MHLPTSSVTADHRFLCDKLELPGCQHNVSSQVCLMTKGATAAGQRMRQHPHCCSPLRPLQASMAAALYCAAMAGYAELTA